MTVFSTIESIEVSMLDETGNRRSVIDVNSSTLRKVLLPYALFGAGITLIVTEEVAANIPGLMSIIDLASSLLPGIGHIATVTSFYHTASLFLLAMMLCMPLVVWRISASWCLPTQVTNLRRNDQWFIVASTWAIAIFVFSMIGFFPEVSHHAVISTGGRGGWFVRLITQYRIGLALLGALLFCVAAGTMGIALKLTVVVFGCHRRSLVDHIKE